MSIGLGIISGIIFYICIICLLLLGTSVEAWIEENQKMTLKDLIVLIVLISGISGLGILAVYTSCKFANDTIACDYNKNLSMVMNK